jgi:hypothetical protein
MQDSYGICLSLTSGTDQNISILQHNLIAAPPVGTEGQTGGDFGSPGIKDV